jgi:hypothetical protein
MLARLSLTRPLRSPGLQGMPDEIAELCLASVLAYDLLVEPKSLGQVTALQDLVQGPNILSICPQVSFAAS